MAYRNLYQETVSCLEYFGRIAADVRFVANDTQVVDWDTFAECAKSYNYDSGYGEVEVNQYLVVVGDDWWLERRDYDGSEWWEYKTPPHLKNQKRDNIIQLTNRDV